MASNRHLGRIVTLQSLYEYEFRMQSGDETVQLLEVVERNLEKYTAEIDDKDFVKKLTQGVADAQAELDATLQPIAPEWPLDQVARIDRNILRLGLYELLRCKETVPPKVAINEAVELAKAFGSDNSSKFVNGVLGTAYRTLVEEQSDNGNSKA